MSTVASLDGFRRLAEGCERREQIAGGGSREDARTRLARKAGILPGTLYNLARDRLKRIDFVVRDKLTAFAIRDLQQQIERLEHELALVKQMGAHPAAPRVSEVEAHLSAARALLNETGAGK